MDLSFDLQDFGGKMHHWHSGMDDIYAVGSFAVNGDVHPSREVIVRARDLLSTDLGNDHFQDEDNQDELSFLIESLDEILSNLPETN
jgi:hypothetical protein